MSSIWNPQDRYILSNMTSEKLYAKSPLTTGVSGTSAYIGLEPSATYNETVLYENYNPGCPFGGTLTASEPVTAFERYKIYLRNSERQNQTVIEKYANPTANTATTNKIVTLECFQAGGGGNLFFTINCGQGVWDNTWKVFNYSGGYDGYFNAGGTFNKFTETSGALPVIQKIIGINRKEV